MQKEIHCVTILDGSGGRGMLDQFAPDENGRYKVPVIESPANVHNNCIHLIKASQETFDPQIRPKYNVAILDTGILPDHPVFKRYIKNTIDFTGEGISDSNGHGSMVTWLYLVRSERALTELDVGLYICKILTSDGVGTEENIIKGLKWAQSQNVRFINLSAGIDNREWFGLRACGGQCDVCKTAYELKDKNIMLFAAAGNDGRTVCPAKVGIHFQDAPVIAVGASGSVGGEKESWSGKGNMYSTGTIHIAETVTII